MFHTDTQWRISHRLAPMLAACYAMACAWHEVAAQDQIGAQNESPPERTFTRGTQLSIRIENVPENVTKVQISLSRGGTERLIPAQLTQLEKQSATVVGTLPVPAPRLPLGHYSAVAELDGTKIPPEVQINVVPPGHPTVTLNEFEPPTTDETAPAFFADSQHAKGGPFKATRVVDLLLHGSGFQTGGVVSDNDIYIDHVRQNVLWGQCRGLNRGTADAPVPRVIVAESISAESFRLCNVPVPDNGAILVQVGLGDQLSSPQLFRVFSLGRQAVSTIAAIVALVLAVIPLWLLRFIDKSYVIGGKDYKLRLLFLDPETDTYSLSKLQFYLWTVAALFSYTYLFVSRVFVQSTTWPDIPATLPGIIAVSAGTSIGSQLITAARGSKGSGPVAPGFADLITSGGVVAPDRVQMLLWTLFGVGAFFVSVVQQYPGTITELPAIPDRLLYLMGLSSAGYLGGKLARKAGPVINEIDVTPPDPDGTDAESGVQMRTPDLSGAITTLKSRRASLGTPDGPSAQAAVEALSAAASQAGVAQTSADFTQLMSSLTRLAATAHDKAAAAAKEYGETGDSTAQAPAARDAAIAQGASAALQDFAADVQRAVAAAGAATIRDGESGPRRARSILLRGTNLAADGLLAIDGADLPFRMLVDSKGNPQPDVLAREDGSPDFARVLCLTIDPTKLGESDLSQFRSWFASKGAHIFTLTNLDGQKSELQFSLPPGESQKAGEGR